MLDLMSGISGSFNEELMNAVISGKRFRIVGDNVNFQIGVAQERGSVGKKVHMEHWFGSAAIIQNVTFNHLSSIMPQQDLRQIPCETFILSMEEMNQIVLDFTMLSAQILVEHFPWLNFAKHAVNETIYEMPEEMNQRNKVVPLPVLHKNEQKYAEVVEVLDSYQDLLETVYNAAEKPLVKLHVGGDQLTRERFSGAKRLRAAALTDSERFANLEPITFELFHLQMAVLTAFYQILYDTQNTESFTLHCQKVRLIRKDADGKDVKNHYDSCKDLAESFIKAFVVEAAYEHIGLPNTDVVPDNIPDYSQMSSDEIRTWILEQFTPVLHNVTSVTRSFLHGIDVQPNITDGVNTYANLVVELGLVYMELCNIVKMPSRDRLLRLMKYIMLILKGHNSKSKYALEILRLMCQQFALLSEKAAHESIYGLFVNTGKSIIPADLQMEYLVRLTKTHLRAMCSNVTEKSLKKRSSAFFGMNEISEHFDNVTSTVKRAQRHKRLSSLDDEKRIVESLRAVRPFVSVPGRKVDSQKKDHRNPITKLNMDDFRSWIEKHKVHFYYEL